uniref:Uncharacterized protein n=1 Tax=Arundo donax TaxID=35708 RepID=A0A0A8Z417_ARUDO
MIHPMSQPTVKEWHCPS